MVVLFWWLVVTFPLNSSVELNPPGTLLSLCFGCFSPETLWFFAKGLRPANKCQSSCECLNRLPAGRAVSTGKCRLSKRLTTLPLTACTKIAKNGCRVRQANTFRLFLKQACGGLLVKLLLTPSRIPPHDNSCWLRRY